VEGAKLGYSSPRNPFRKALMVAAESIELELFIVLLLVPPPFVLLLPLLLELPLLLPLPLLLLLPLD
jgi:hypothetical protein